MKTTLLYLSPGRLPWRQRQ